MLFGGLRLSVVTTKPVDPTETIFDEYLSFFLSLKGEIVHPDTSTLQSNRIIER